ncbi:DUF917 domain-containing protein [Candidatus Cryosericum septentrionale]|nr:DUF917 domain-containing protein [Candidatus Cryosericum septentrionale]
MSTVIANKLQVEDLARGATFFGTGGGGEPTEGAKAVLSEVEQGKKISLIDVQELSDDDLVACPFLMGSIAPLTKEKLKEMEMFGLSKKIYDYKGMMATAVKELANYAGKKISAVVPIELGGGNTLAAAAAGSSLNITIVDGDFSGRAIPEISQGTPFLADKTIYPISSVDEFGNICIIKNAINTLVVERIGKYISAASFSLAAQCGFLMSGKEAKETIISGTVSKCLEVGAFIRKSRESGQKVLDPLVNEVGGWLLFKGIVSAKETEDKDGYYWGTHTLNGVDEFSGQTFKIWFKNENHISWKDDKPFVTSPDLIIVVDLDTGEPITNTNLKITDRVGVIGMKAKEMFRTSKGLAILGPRHFGFDWNYRPIEEVVK